MPDVCTRAAQSKYIIGEPDACNVKYFDLLVTREPIRVFRAFSKTAFACGEDSPARQFGAWWTFDRPHDKRRTRIANAVCNRWNDFSMIVECTLKAGSVVAVGPSIECLQELLLDRARVTLVKPWISATSAK